MLVEITEYHTKQMCLWCSKETESVTANFDDGFLENACLCWRCLQNATKVRANKERGQPSRKKPSTTS